MTVMNTSELLPHLVIGDLNAIKRSDYLDTQWKHLCNFFKVQSWNGPEYLVTDLFSSAGYKDLAEGYKGNLFTAWTYNLIFRIDYILASNNFPYESVNFKNVESCFASDHFPIYTDIIIKKHE